jgi:hypothetical protein
MKNKDELRDELNELSPLLAKRRGMDEGFKVPKDYFRSLPDEVLKKVRPETPPIVEPQRNGLAGLTEFLQNLFQPRYALAYASVAVLIAVGIYFFVNQPVADAPQIAEVETEALENYLEENIDAISTDLLEEQFAESGTESMPSLELEAVEDYLDGSLDDIDLDDLEELL